jgi:prepilin-type N-terminal cleavage/methylation domain-containing protein/prepilin-type processing-associated H-X9-DG protein
VHQLLRAIAKQGVRVMKWRGFTVIELVVVIVIIVVVAAITLPRIARSREKAARVACQSNLKQMGLIFKTYANESLGEKFPTVGRGFAAIDGPALYPDYMTDDTLLVCPSDSDAVAFLDRGGPDGVGFWYELDANGNRRVDPSRFSALSYLYMGWVATEAAHLENVGGILSAHGLTLNNNIDHPIKDEDLDTTGSGGLGPGTGNAGGDTIYRIRMGIEWELYPDRVQHPTVIALPQSTIPLLFDTVSTDIGSFNHVPTGANVLYVDGHIEFVRYPENYPVSGDAAEIIERFDF